ncbi:MAG: hypothetical protein QNL12_02310, partial [Acidimicrobiia bacterium]|nr:hypothetical protein [Acidimicrobiia bacterium]MDX2466120.1 hypothetical protein [Acidimicrobiia bacterium]
MADGLMRFLYRPGWRLRCVDPPIAWLRLEPGDVSGLGIRLQLTCYLASRWAGAVRVKQLRLRLRDGAAEILVPCSSVVDDAGEPFPGESGYRVGNAAPTHAFADFVSVDPAVIAVLGDPGLPVPVVIEALLNAAPDFRKIADVDISHDSSLQSGGDWKRVGTG